jgi:predicted DNA-binding transcriptional regulator YafY
LGAAIEGEPGVGYILKPGFLLPPLMFTPEELEALVLGSRWVAERTDGSLAAAAGNALARISAVLPSELQNELAMTTLLIGPSRETPQNQIDPALLRQAIRQETKLTLVYRDAADSESRRTIWPFALAYFDAVRVLLGWCELREDFRSFRTDRILAVEPSEQRYPQRRQTLLRDWRKQMERQRDASA